MKYKLYLLRPIEGLSPSDPWYPWYDKVHGFVIAAKPARLQIRVHVMRKKNTQTSG